MDDIQEVFYLTSVEQARAIADTLRLRLIDALQREPLTVTQLGERVGESAAKVHYHVRELERVGVVQLVETRERGGILEKYYRAVAKSFQVAPDLLQTAPRSEIASIINEWFQFVMRESMRAINHRAQHPDEDEPLMLASEPVFSTVEEFRDLLQQLTDLTKPFEHPRNVAGEKEWLMNLIAHRVVPSPADEAGIAAPAMPPVPPVPPMPPLPSIPSATAKPHLTRAFLIGAQSFSRAELERAVEEQRPMEITVIGICHFADDIPAELVDRAVVKFRHWGQLVASPAVRDVLRRKGGEA